MTPKEKAIDLVRDMEFEIPYVHDPTEPQGDDIAKRCALIAVNEIISIKLLWYQKDTKELDYWNDVKKEIDGI
jgi:hypothetical protein